MKGIFILLLLGCCAWSLTEDEYLRPIGRPKEATAQRLQGGEAIPPLPIPATPLRRSEKKRPPSPTALIGKVVWGSYLDYRHADSKVQRVFDWNMVPADVQQLLYLVQGTLHLQYTSKSIDIASFSGQPSELPMLYVSGGRSITFTPAERMKLRNYLLSGGTIVFDAVAGSPYFFKAAVLEMQKILPECSVTKVALDHALYRMASRSVEVTINGEKSRPEFYGVYVGSRLAAIIIPFGIGAAWDYAVPQLIPGAKVIDIPFARQLGVNIVSYVIGWFRTGQALSLGSAPEIAADRANLNKIVFAQLKTDGIWNTDPGAETRFMGYLLRTHKIDAGTAPRYVDAEKEDLEQYPFLYLAGLGNYKLSPRGLEALRSYLQQGGFIMVNNTLGMNEYDAATAKFCQEVLPGSKLERIQPADPLFSTGPCQLRKSGFSPAAKAKYPGQNFPLLYGIKQDGRWALVYSPVDMAGGWLGTARPGSVTYENDTALQLGANILVYFLTR